MNRRNVAVVMLSCLGLLLVAAESMGGEPGRRLADAHCPPLSPPVGAVETVSTVAQLQAAVSNAAPNTTILVADGAYDLDGAYLRFETEGVTLRSASGDRDAVVLDGNTLTTEIIQIVASDVTIADLTLREAYYHPIHVMSSAAGDVENTLIYNVHIVDPGEQAIKINPAAAGFYPDDGVIACSHIELTDSGRPHIRNDCYTGGIDAHQAQGWHIRDNVIEGFWCESGLSEHAIHMWRGSRDTLVERNLLRDNARGIGFGLVTSGDARTYADDPCPSAGGGYVDHYGGVVRNNWVFASREALFASQYGFDCGICLWQACGAWVVHNTVAATQDPFSSIEWRFDHTDVDIRNNLATFRLLDRGGTARLAGNLEYQPLSLFVDGANGDLHLSATAAAAIDQAAPVAAGLCDEDIDGDPRPLGAARDVGADEYGVAPPAPVADLRVTDALTVTGWLTATLRWTAPAEAVTVTLRYSGSLISEDNWAAALPLGEGLAGSADSTVAVVPDSGDTAYFALRYWGAGAGWSAPSNNAFWPKWDLALPVALQD